MQDPTCMFIVAYSSDFMPSLVLTTSKFCQFLSNLCQETSIFMSSLDLILSKCTNKFLSISLKFMQVSVKFVTFPLGNSHYYAFFSTYFIQIYKQNSVNFCKFLSSLCMETPEFMP